MIRSTIFGLTLAALATPALSLSCVRPDVANTYNFAAQADEKYVVVHGTLSFNKARLPQAAGNDSPPTTKIKARLTGKALSENGFDHPFDRPITLEVHCFGPWCGSAEPGAPYLGFVQHTTNGYVLAVDPCGGMGFSNPTNDMLKRVQSCFKGGACQPHSQ